MRIKIILGVLLTAVAVAGCANVVGGEAGPGDVRPLKASDVLGDFETVDYCSVLDADALSRAGGYVEHSRPSFDECFVDVVADDIDVRMRLGPLAYEPETSEEPDEEIVRPRGLRVQEYDSSETGRCAHYLVFPDGMNIQVSVEEREEQVESGVLCELSEAAVNGIRSFVSSSRIGHFEFGTESLGWLAACDLTSEQEVEEVIGEPAPQSTPPTSHWCFWGGEYDDSLSVSLEFSVQDLPRSYLEEGYYPDDIAGRPSSVFEYESGACVADTPHLPFGEHETGQIEVVSIYVEGPEDGDMCKPAEALAKVVWPRLPES
ncbi:hypothetical protein BAY61_25340 [Prauserella marina]|uniref:Uncharacterized protein n=1 Tax=Prauserella marina TaxID=530584 RepID=A0A222VV08_9PSEU|nr:hypothetical protein [Prauserella marina]ASR37776.1 hypothetical protein BAY61_25340 [Prauserella marina]PWV75728.1 hypothetical protein DES30_106346 [Prauserella marina]SDD27698.1 hypothetical protein SAMN05421630_10795 [Prauserella marina]